MAMDRKQFLKASAATFAATMLAGPLAACTTEQPGSGSGSGSASTDGDTTPKIVAILISSSSEVTAAQGNAIQAYADEHGADCTVQYYDQDVSTEASMIENAITSGANILLIQPQSASDCQTEIQSAYDAGLIVLIYGTKVDGADYTYYYGEDGHTLGRQLGADAAAWAQEHIVDAGNTVVAALGTYSISPEIAGTRYEGAYEALLEAIPDAEIIDPPFEAAYKEEGLEAGENLLQSHPDVNLVIGCNDQSTIGVYEAFVAGGKDDPESIGMFGLDGTAEAMALIAQDTMFKETVGIDASAVGQEMVAVGIAELTGEGDLPDEQDTYWEGTAITADNVEDYRDQWEDLV